MNANSDSLVLRREHYLQVKYGPIMSPPKGLKHFLDLFLQRCRTYGAGISMRKRQGLSQHRRCGIFVE
jgi:hypothetical protein